MRTCPTCNARYAAAETECTADGTPLVDEDVLETSTTMRHSAAGSSAVPASATPAPLVRANVRRSEPGPDPIIGASLGGRYQVTGKIGEGGMGAVYEARHSLIGKRVAIKVLLDKYAQKPDVVARLQQEARLASSIGHENIVDITDFGETEDGRTFVVMEFLDGESLAALLQREGPLPPRRAVAIARQIASALGAAHAKNIVHRDIKPENVFITRRGDKDYVKVVDFGISKAMKLPADEAGDELAGTPQSPRLTHTGMVLGTPLYMSPEQARGEDELDHRIDIYALGIILYETLTGEVPFRGTNYLNIISQVIATEPRPPSEVRPDLEISAALERVVLQAMAKDRELRYHTMAELNADLARVSGDEPTGGPLTGARLARARRSKLLPWLAWGGGIAGVVIGVALVVPRLMRTSGAPRPADGVVQPPPVPAPPPPPPPAPPPAQPPLKMVHERVNSRPLGAEVFWAAVSKGKTPADLEFPQGKDLIELVLKLDGYEDAHVKFYPTRDDTVTVTLKKARASRAPVVKPPPTLPPPDRGPTAGGEIKPNPLPPPDPK